MDDNETNMLMAFAACLAITIMVCVGVNVMADHTCKLEAIKAGMTSTQVAEACK